MSLFACFESGSLDAISEACSAAQPETLREFVPRLVCLVEGAEAAKPENQLHAKRLFNALAQTRTANTVLEYVDIDINALHRQLDQDREGGVDEGREVQFFERATTEQRTILVFHELRHRSLDFSSSALLDSTFLRDEIACILSLAILKRINIVPLPSLVSILLRSENGEFFISHLICSRPDLLRNFIRILIDTIIDMQLVENVDEADCDSDVLCVRLLSVLRAIQSLSVGSAVLLRSMLVRASILPELVWRITLQSTDDEIAFLSATLNSFHRRMRDSSVVVRAFAAEVLRSGNATPKAMRSAARAEPPKPTRITAALRASLGSDASFVVDWCGRLRAHLRNGVKAFGSDSRIDGAVAASEVLSVYCRLKVVSALVFRREDVDVVLSILAAVARQEQPNVELVKVAITFLFLCSNLFKLSTKEQVTRVLEDLARRHSTSLPFFNDIGALSYNGERQLPALLSELLQLPVRPRNTHLEAMSELFRSHVLSEVQVVERALASSGLSSLSTLLHILSSGLLARLHQQREPLQRKQDYERDSIVYGDKGGLRAYLLSRVLSAPSLPLAALVPALLERSAALCLWLRRRSSAHPPNSYLKARSNLTLLLPVSSISELLEDNFYYRDSPLRPLDSYKNPASLLLVIYYILHYNSLAQKSVDERGVHLDTVEGYPISLLRRLPIPSLLHYIKRSQLQNASSNFDILVPSLMTLLLSQLPELFSPKVALFEFVTQPQAQHRLAAVPPLHAESLRTHLSAALEHPLNALRCLHSLRSMPPDLSSEHAETVINVLLPLLSNPDIDERCRAYFHDLFERWRLCFGLPLLYKTAVRLVRRSSASLDDLIQDPLILLKCDRFVFSSAPLLRVILSILDVFCALSRSLYLSLPPPGSDGKAADVDSRDIVPLTQESAVLQVLLEFVHPRFEAGAECRSIVLSYVQERLTDEPRLLRILHMQRYDAELIPFVVEEVAAVGDGVELVRELLSCADAEAQAFALRLLSCASQRYRSETWCALCETVLRRLASLDALELEQRRALIVASLPALRGMAAAFPTLSEPVVRLLLRARTPEPDAQLDAAFANLISSLGRQPILQ